MKLLHPAARLPTKAHDTDAGFDLYACTPETLSGPSTLVKVGIALSIPEGYFGLVRDRSGNALRHLRVSAGVIDSGYRGEIGVVLDNLNPAKLYHIAPGDRIAQLLILPVPHVECVEVEHLDATPRGMGGFNSTGA